MTSSVIVQVIKSPETKVVEVLTRGLQGVQGETGPVGPLPNIIQRRIVISAQNILVKKFTPPDNRA